MITRRSLLTGSIVLAGSRALAGKQPDHEEVSPLEDLMREHGLLNRILLIYEECVRRLESKNEMTGEAVARAATIIQKFVEGYHEKLEEEHLFPRLVKLPKMKDLVRVLKAQHEAGRTITTEILAVAPSNDMAKKRLAELLRAFVRMYRPHEAREDTVLFPAFQSLVTEKEYDKLGEAFEAREHQLFGEDGFEKMVAQVAEIESALGIFDLAQFTPKV